MKPLRECSTALGSVATTINRAANSLRGPTFKRKIEEKNGARQDRNEHRHKDYDRPKHAKVAVMKTDIGVYEKHDKSNGAAHSSL